MSNAEEKTTFGVTIIRPSSPDEITTSPSAVAKPLPTLNTKASNLSDAPSSLLDSAASPNYESANPFSAFYQHPESRSHLEVNRPRKQGDLESGSHLEVKSADNAFPSLSTATTATQPKVSVDGRVKECTVWPTKDALRERARQDKYKDRRCQCWGNMNKKQKLWVKVLIGLTVVALAVGLSVGISRAVGGGVWAGTGESHTISNNR